MAKYTHIHQYYLTKIGTKTWQVYKCAIPGCPHFLPHIKHAHNRQSICWGCGDVFILHGAKHRRVMKPKCDNCRQGRRDEESRVNRDTIKELAEKLGSI